MCERVWREAQKCALSRASWLDLAVGKSPKEAHVWSMQGSWRVKPAGALQDKTSSLVRQLARGLDSRLSKVVRPSCQTTLFVHSFKNRTGPAGPTGSTRNRSQIRSSYDKKQEMTKKPVNSKSRLVQPENRKNQQSNRLMPDWGFLTFPVKTMLFWSLKTNPKPNLITLSSQFITHALLCLTPHSLTHLKLSSLNSSSLCLTLFSATPLTLSLTSLWLSASRTAACRHAWQPTILVGVFSFFFFPSWLVSLSPFELCFLLIR